MNTHEPEWQVLDIVLSQRPLILDVGANIGQSIRSFKLLREHAKIVSFEPNPLFAEPLQQIASENADVTVVNAGLGDGHDRLEFFTPVLDGAPRLEETTTRKEVFDLPHVRAKYGAGTFKIESFVAEVNIGDSFGFSPELIKIDVEGAELQVLRGFDDTIKRSQPLIMTENSFTDEVIQFLSSHNYIASVARPGSHDVFLPFRAGTLNTFHLPPRFHHMIS